MGLWNIVLKDDCLYFYCLFHDNLHIGCVYINICWLTSKGSIICDVRKLLKVKNVNSPTITPLAKKSLKLIEI